MPDISLIDPEIEIAVRVRCRVDYLKRVTLTEHLNVYRFCPAQINRIRPRRLGQVVLQRLTTKSKGHEHENHDGIAMAHDSQAAHLRCDSLPDMANLGFTRPIP